MYKEFITQCCNGEQELDKKYMHEITKHHKYTGSYQFPRLEAPIQFFPHKECDVVKTTPNFCKRDIPVCNEMLFKTRNGNGNDQKMFLLSTKSKDYKNPYSFYWKENANKNISLPNAYDNNIKFKWCT